MNNVGTNVRGTPTVEYTTSDYDFVMNTNLTSAFHLTQVCWASILDLQGFL